MSKKNKCVKCGDPLKEKPHPNNKLSNLCDNCLVGTADKGIVIGTKEEALWTQVKTETENKLEQLEKALILEKAVLELAKNKILLEKRK